MYVHCLKGESFLVYQPRAGDSKENSRHCVCNKLYLIDCKDWVSLAAPTVWLFYIVITFSLWLSYYNVINLSLVFIPKMPLYQVFCLHCLLKLLVPHWHKCSMSILPKQCKNFSTCRKWKKFVVSTLLLSNSQNVLNIPLQTEENNASQDSAVVLLSFWAQHRTQELGEGDLFFLHTTTAS